MLIAREGDTTTLGLKAIKLTDPPANGWSILRTLTFCRRVHTRTFCDLWTQMIQYKSTMYIL